MALVLSLLIATIIVLALGLKIYVDDNRELRQRLTPSNKDYSSIGMAIRNAQHRPYPYLPDIKIPADVGPRHGRIINAQGIATLIVFANNAESGQAIKELMEAAEDDTLYAAEESLLVMAEIARGAASKIIGYAAEYRPNLIDRWRKEDPMFNQAYRLNEALKHADAVETPHPVNDEPPSLGVQNKPVEVQRPIDTVMMPEMPPIVQ